MKTQYLLAASLSGFLTSTTPAQVIFEDTFGGCYSGNGGVGAPITWSNFNPYSGSTTLYGAISSGLMAGSTNRLADCTQGREFAFALGQKHWPFDVPHFHKDGGQYIWTSYAISSFQMDDFSRSISGFTLGGTYNISGEQQNIVWAPLIATLDYVDQSALSVLVNGNYTSNGGLWLTEYVSGFAATSLSSLLDQEFVAESASYFSDVVLWNTTSITFTATATTHAIGFANAFSPQFDLNHPPYEAPWGPVLCPSISSPPIFPVFAP